MSQPNTAGCTLSEQWFAPGAEFPDCFRGVPANMLSTDSQRGGYRNLTALQADKLPEECLCV